MRLRSFYGTTLSDAMNQVRVALGDNAIIVSTRDEDNGSVRVTAAIDDKPASSAPSSGADAGDRSAALAHSDASNGGSEILEKIAQTLLAHHVPPSLAERILAATMQFANDDPVVALASAFDTHFQFDQINIDQTDSPIIFIGLPGSGKTLTVSKIATKLVLNRKQATLVSTDSERAGASQQIKAFAQLLKTDLIEVHDTPALHDAIGIAPKNQLILIDTPSCNPLDAKDRRRIDDYIKATKAIPILMLPADWDSTEAIDSIRSFQAMGVRKALVTRVDLVKRLGHVLRAAFETKISLCAYSASPNVTVAPLPLNPIALARLILPKELQKDTGAFEVPIPKDTDPSHTIPSLHTR